MKHTLRLMIGAAALLASTLAFAETATLKGTVQAKEDDDYNITSAKLVLDDGTVYRIVLDEAGRKIADEAYWEVAEVTGDVQEKDGQKWLTVQSFKKFEVSEDPAD